MRARMKKKASDRLKPFLIPDAHIPANVREWVDRLEDEESQIRSGEYVAFRDELGYAYIARIIVEVKL